MPQLLRPPPWTERAACRDLAVPAFDPWNPDDELTAAEQALQHAYARLVCAGCPVRHPCALEALKGGIGHGVWGGLTVADRRRIARKHGYPQPAAAACGTRSRYVTGCRCDDCREAHRRWAEGRRAAGAWVRNDSKGRRRQSDPRAKVLRAVKRAGGPVTARAVYRATGIKVSQVRQIVAAAETAGELAPGLVA